LKKEINFGYHVREHVVSHGVAVVSLVVVSDHAVYFFEELFANTLFGQVLDFWVVSLETVNILCQGFP